MNEGSEDRIPNRNLRSGFSPEIDEPCQQGRVVKTHCLAKWPASVCLSLRPSDFWSGRRVARCCYRLKSMNTAEIPTSFPASYESKEKGVILLVEDELFVRKVTTEVLESAGYSVIVAGSATEALEACRTFAGEIHLLLTDVVMPGASGRELGAEFESCYPHTRVLLMTGYAEQLNRSLPSGRQNACISKPFSRDRLLERVHAMIETKPASL
jgi:CheY-like chemotaxis protein